MPALPVRTIAHRNETAAPTPGRSCQGPGGPASFARLDPGDRVLHIGLREPELGQLCTHAIGAIDANRREHDTAVLRGHISSFA